MAFAFIFSDVGVGEWFVLLAVVLVVVGPNRLPAAARSLGRWYSRLSRMAESFRRQLMEIENDVGEATDAAGREIEGAFTVEPDKPVEEKGGPDQKS
jgi:Tat protein translocase TatB subunit